MFIKIISDKNYWCNIGEIHEVFDDEKDWPKDSSSSDRRTIFDGRGTHYRLKHRESYVRKSDAVVLSDSGVIEGNAKPLAEMRREAEVSNVDPGHYRDGKIEVIEFIMDKNLNFNRGNAVKYVVRAGKKNPDTEVEDIKKAIRYLEFELERLQA